MKIYRSKALIGENNIGLHRHAPLAKQAEHTHDYIEIEYVTRGKATVYINGTKYEVVRGDMIFMSPETSHAFEPGCDFEHIEIFFSPKLIGEGLSTTSDMLARLAMTSYDDLRLDKNYGLVHFSGSDLRETEALLDIMQREYSDKEHDYESIMCNCLNTILIRMIRNSLGSAERTDIWSKLKEYIDENIEKHLTLTHLASKCFYNPSYFSRQFKKKLGTSLTVYVKSKRIDRAKELLLTESCPVEEISKRIGFTDRSAFYAAFFESTGKTPSEYRVEHKK